MNKKQKIEKANKRIRILNQAVDQASAAGNQQAADSFRESLHKARMERIPLGNEDD
jgi:hypothetical protein